ncbi:MAG: hypothetical protein KDD04_07840 [Sinomicrobium sp.]|nr:hypothetical protein [Sinomicrobium sp.]
MGKRILMNCEDANHVCDKNQYKESSGIEKIKLIIHLAYCKACRKYSISNHKLTHLIKKAEIEAQPVPKVETIDESEKNEMKMLFEKELSKLK